MPNSQQVVVTDLSFFDSEHSTERTNVVLGAALLGNLRKREFRFPSLTPVDTTPVPRRGREPGGKKKQRYINSSWRRG